MNWLRRANVWRQVTSPERQANQLTSETTRPQPRCDGVQPIKHTATQALVTIAIALAIVVTVKVIQARATEILFAVMNDSAGKTSIHQVNLRDEPSQRALASPSKCLAPSNKS